MSENNEKKVSKSLYAKGVEDTGELLFYILFYYGIKVDSVRMYNGEENLYEVKFKASDETFDNLVSDRDKFVKDMELESYLEKLREGHFRTALLAEAIANREAILSALIKDDVSKCTYCAVQEALDAVVGSVQHLVSRDRPGPAEAILDCWARLDSRKEECDEGYTTSDR